MLGQILQLTPRTRASLALICGAALAACSGATVTEEDHCGDPVVGPWYRSDGTKALWPNFVAPSDGATWIYPLPSGTIGLYAVLVSQHGPDKPTAPANLAAVVYDNATGSAMSSTDVIDVPSLDKHLMSVQIQKSGDGATVTLSLQAPSAAPNEDAGLWIWSVPACN